MPATTTGVDREVRMAVSMLREMESMWHEVRLYVDGQLLVALRRHGLPEKAVDALHEWLRNRRMLDLWDAIRD